MIAWPDFVVPYLKAVHLLALFVWCGGLIVMPLMLSRHDPTHSQIDFTRIRRATHLTYTVAVTPAAVIAVVAGTWLIFFREVLVPWLYLKLFFVAALVGAHAWIGHILVQVAETKGRHEPPEPYLPIAAVLLPMLAILILVLGKFDFSWIEFPEWMTEPRNNQLLFDVPRR